MSGLPDRDTARRYVLDAVRITAAYVRGELKSRDEMDEEAAAKRLQQAKPLPDDQVITWEIWAAQILDAGFGVDDE